MPADYSTHSRPRKRAARAAGTCRPNAYCVPPVLVKDLTTQCAAHFVAHFATNSNEHIRDVLKGGVNGPDGMIEEVAYWLSQCEADASGSDSDLGYWDLEEMGPWIYDALDAADVSRVVTRHTKGWSTSDFASYGYTVKEKAELDAAVAGMK
ncbi:hypothetical protein C8J31_11437 [Rhizobium sp. PP-CC-2G-626]|nr:hypothetical protein C8J31_11437 [Rhizobium sp. PP-CC-2G-626]